MSLPALTAVQGEAAKAIGLSELEYQEGLQTAALTEACQPVAEAAVSTYRLGLDAGRREVLLEVAATKPDSISGDCGRCNYCDARLEYPPEYWESSDEDDAWVKNGHNPDCLWLRSRQALSS